MFHYEALPLYIKRILLFFIVIVTAALQNTVGLMPTLFGARFFPLIPLVVAIGMCDGELSGLFYGAAAGAFWDVCSFGPDGIFAFYLALTGCTAGFLVHYFMKNRLLTQYCISCVSVTVCIVLYWYLSVSLPVGDAKNEKLMLFYLPSAVITSAMSFIVYYFIRFICNKFKIKENMLRGGEFY